MSTQQKYAEIWLILFLLIAGENLSAQVKSDSLSSASLQEVTIKAWLRKDIDRLPEENGVFLSTGKKSEVVTLSSTNANISLKNSRQVFAKIPGVFVYEMDGSGNQVNIATRGLDAHRSWEFNNRQNGVLINSDMYGYPASHYSAPMESVERVELVRGTGSLQYGAQFGGMINFITRRPDSSRPFVFESVNATGSFGLLSTYNSISGTVKKFSYAAYYYNRHSGGYRQNSESDAVAQFVQLEYRFNKNFRVQASFGRSKYLYHIPGPLNDSMFTANPRMSTRSRNYFSPDIYVPSVTANWIISPKTQLSVVVSGVLGSRNSVMLDAFATVPDTVSVSTGLYKNRQVDIDNFNSRTAELRVLHRYSLNRMQAKLSVGLVWMNNDLHRRQLGKGTAGSNYDVTVLAPGFMRDLHFKSGNIALFAENEISFNSKLSVSAGLRWEKGASDMSGLIQYYAPGNLPNRITHNFLLAGISGRYQFDADNMLYAGVSQAYRPVIFKDIIPASVYEQIDKNLKDANGYNFEVGLRGRLLKSLQYDISLFRLLYKNRMGTMIFTDNNNPYTYKTNVGNSITTGVEWFTQYRFHVTGKLFAGVFTSTAYMHGVYSSGMVSNGTFNKNISGNKIEGVPAWISRNGLELLFQSFSCTVLYSYTSASYADALNTVITPVTGAKGLVPAYSLWDINASEKLNTMITLRAGVSNIFNIQYFTKRPAFYPGPGIWPGDGRNWYVTASIKL